MYGGATTKYHAVDRQPALFVVGYVRKERDKTGSDGAPTAVPLGFVVGDVRTHIDNFRLKLE